MGRSVSHLIEDACTHTHTQINWLSVDDSCAETLRGVVLHVDMHTCACFLRHPTAKKQIKASWDFVYNLEVKGQRPSHLTSLSQIHRPQTKRLFALSFVFHSCSLPSRLSL